MPLATSARQRGKLEAALLKRGVLVAGVDEVGRGCLAGPVFAACAVLDYERLALLPRKTRALVRDSKELSRGQRVRIIPVLEKICLGLHVASASVEEIERHGIAPATFLAMRRALARLPSPADVVLVDGKLKISGYDGVQQTIVKGDNLCFAIAAASIFAKEARDDFMRFQATKYPAYGFDSHVGYGTRHHMAMIEAHGICTLHRRNFEPIRRHGNPTSAQPNAGLFD